ncbi:MAG TPA: 50S ribosomal protein L9 [Candidatus Hydrogenedentes bacterium]|nr:50S ribosomal protein L9 [Candidatus Hydrogenedentota bacterium]HOV62025.1 50S ribosomal protein L9 [Candidatus Hydrogenedentota bacterium]
MNVILCEDVENLGSVGQKVTVADGYARNYLIPRKLAVPVDAASAKQIEHEMRIIRKREERRRAELTALARRIEGLTLEFEMRAGEHDKLFGSVTTAMIAEKLAEAGFEVSRKTIMLEEPIKALGIYSVVVRLAGGIEASVKVWVKGLEGEVTTETEPVEVDEDDEDDEDDDEE